MQGLIGTGKAYEDQATYGLEQAADLEQRRNEQTKANKASRVASMAGLAGTGAALGSVAGPPGMIVGAGIGLLAGSLM